MNNKYTPIEAKMQADYDMIAEAFAASNRAIKWKELKTQFLSLPQNALILDIGCGAGRLCPAIVEEGFDYMGIDLSKGQIKQAKNICDAGQFMSGSMLHLPFEDNQFDAVIMVASFHHLQTDEERVQALNEANRVLKNNGEILVTVMNFWRSKFWKLIFSKKDYDKVDVKLKNQLKWNDIIWPWKWKTNNPVYRYYHAFYKSELNKLFKKTSFKISKSEFMNNGRKENFYKGKNIVVVAKKVV